MKKFLLVLSMIFMINPVMAKSLKVEALSDFSTATPPKMWKVKVIEGFVTEDGFILHPNSIIEGKITDVVSPKRLKRTASFRFIPKTYYDPQIGYTKDIKKDFEGKYSKKSEITAKKVAKQTAITAGDLLVGAFVGPSVALVEGVVKNEEGNRAKSAVVSVYESTPLSLANKGKELEFKKGQVFIMNFKSKGDDEIHNNEPNYSYEIINN